MLLNCGVGEDSWESLRQQGGQTSQSLGNWPRIFFGRVGAEAEAPTLWPSDTKSRLIGKDPDSEKDWRQEEMGATVDEMVRYYHRLNRHEFEQKSGDDRGQRSLACCSPWGHKELHTTERLHFLTFPFFLMVFLVATYGCESWTTKKAEHQRIDAFQL